jgi:hypothetical protein
MRSLLGLLPALLAAQAPVSKDRQLFSAIHQGDTAAVRAALKAGASANAVHERGTTALMHAAAFAPAGGEGRCGKRGGVHAAHVVASQPGEVETGAGRGSAIDGAR